MHAPIIVATVIRTIPAPPPAPIHKSACNKIQGMEILQYDHHCKVNNADDILLMLMFDFVTELFADFKPLMNGRE